jgi:hypothetical protein
MAETHERCLRCGASMQWLHQTWQCGRCRFKLGCCEGECPSDERRVASVSVAARD